MSVVARASASKSPPGVVHCSSGVTLSIHVASPGVAVVTRQGERRANTPERGKREGEGNERNMWLWRSEMGTGMVEEKKEGEGKKRNMHLWRSDMSRRTYTRGKRET